MNDPILLVNFGGPRNLEEVSPFLQALLCDQDVIRTPLPSFLHNWFFRRVAKKRALKIREDYELIGGKSPIYFDTEKLAEMLGQKCNTRVYTFHRYLPATHELSYTKIAQEKNLIVLPLFPQFCYATTGSIARCLLPFSHLQWIQSYASHPAFIKASQKRIADFLLENNLPEHETVLLFSAHGVPKKFIEGGDIYESECESSFNEVMRAFPNTLGRLCYQSKFGKGEWLRPYTNEASEEILTWCQGRKHVVFIPISFTSDHIETLFEIETLYLPLIRAKGLNAYRCPALGLAPYWIDALIEILNHSTLIETSSLIR